MANNISRLRNFNEKKQKCISAYNFRAEDFVDEDGTGEFLIGTIPERATVVEAYIATEIACDAGTTVDVIVDTTTIIAAGAVDAVADETFPIATPVNTKSGRNVKIIPSAIPTQGRFTVMIEYIEYTLRTACYTQEVARNS